MQGALASLGCVLSVWLGLHYGHLLKHPGAHFKSRTACLLHWLSCSTVLITLGCILEHWEPMNKQLWTVSYAIYMAGTCGLALSLFYLLVDCLGAQGAKDDTTEEGGLSTACGLVGRLGGVLFEPLRWMGMNAILVFTWHGLATVCLDMVFWDESLNADGSTNPGQGA